MAINESIPPGVVCTGLVKIFGTLRAVDGVDLRVEAGESFGLLGPNGAGKTTTIEMMEGLTPLDGGTLSVLGWSWGQGHDRELRERLGVQLQETQLQEKLTVAETIRLFRSFFRRGRPVDDVLALVDLNDKRDARVGKLSGGQKQRLALALGLLSDPDLLFLDEPTTGLDPQARASIWEIVERFHARGGTVMLTTHYMEEAARLCDRVAIMDHGQVISVGAPSALVDQLGADQIIEFRAGERFDPLRLAALPGVAQAQTRNGGHRLTVTRVSEALPALMAELDRQGVKLETLTTHQPTLEDVFLHLTGRGLRDG
jgi:ABC-2 type transport system ATP-binding protein